MEVRITHTTRRRRCCNLGGVLFTDDLNNDFLALDAKSGDVLYRFNTGGSIGGGGTYAITQMVCHPRLARGDASWATGDHATRLNEWNGGLEHALLY